MIDTRPRPQLGQYELLRPIGSGGMGVVYEAVHRTLGRRVAVKVLHAREAANEVQLARFMREGRAAGQVRHAHVVDVFDFGVDDGLPFLVMELVEGETLAQRIARGGPIPLPALAELMLPVVSAVAELHAAGIVHRDLKPANILLARDRGGDLCPKVADFGVSRFLDGSAALDVTDSKAVLGTYAYMSPEQCRSSRDATEQADLYALGAILYECATGTPPFDAPCHYDLLNAIMSAPLEEPSRRRAGLPAEFDALALRALARLPEDRLACAEEMGEALLAFAEPQVRARWASEFHPPSTRDDDHHPSVDGLTSSRSIRIQRPVRRWRGAALGVGLVATVAFGAFATRHLVVASAGATSASLSMSPVATTAPTPVTTGAAPAACAPAAVPAPPPSTISAAGPAPGPRAAMPRPWRRTAQPSLRAIVPGAPQAPAAAPSDNGAPILDPR